MGRYLASSPVRLARALERIDPEPVEQSADAEPDAGSIRTPFAQPDAAADAPPANDVDKTLN